MIIFWTKKVIFPFLLKENSFKGFKGWKKNNKIEVNPQDFPFENKNKNCYNNNNHKRYKAPYINLNGILFLKK